MSEQRPESQSVHGPLQEYRSEKRERETKAKTQEERIREYLTEVAGGVGDARPVGDEKGAESSRPRPN